jgi:hypothetical protein
VAEKLLPMVTDGLSWNITLSLAADLGSFRGKVNRGSSNVCLPYLQIQK